MYLMVTCDTHAVQEAGESRRSLRTGDLDEARTVIEEMFYSNRMYMIGREQRLDAAFDVCSLGALTVGDLCCGADVRMRLGDLGSYHVNIPLSGRLSWRQGGQETVTASSSHAAVFHPYGETTLDRWEDDCRVLAVKIQPEALLRRLEMLLDRTVPGPVPLARLLDVTQGPGLSWARQVRLVADEMDNPKGALRQPLMAAQVEDALLTGLLLATDHIYSDELASPVRESVPRAVEQVREMIHAHPERPFTTTELAALGKVGPRWLQEGFRRHVGMSPMAYVREVRLRRVHGELLRAVPDSVTVSEVAYRWGFTHLGRFAESYRAQFGRLPSQTLRLHP